MKPNYTPRRKKCWWKSSERYTRGHLDEDLVLQPIYFANNFMMGSATIFTYLWLKLAQSQWLCIFRWFMQSWWRIIMFICRRWYNSITSTGSKIAILLAPSRSEEHSVTTTTAMTYFNGFWSSWAPPDGIDRSRQSPGAQDSTAWHHTSQPMAHLLSYQSMDAQCSAIVAQTEDKME